MSESIFINKYVDNAIGYIHENISAILQLRTQLSLLNELVQEKDRLIAEIQKNQEETLAAGFAERDEEIKVLMRLPIKSVRSRVWCWKKKQNWTNLSKLSKKRMNF